MARKDLKSRITLSLITRIAGGLVNLAFTVMLGRILGPAELGSFLIGFAAAAIVATAGRLGLEQIIIREISPKLSLGNFDSAQNFYTKVIKLGFYSSTILALIGWLSAHTIAIQFYEKPEIESVLRWFAVTVIPITVSALHASFLQAAKRAESGLAILTLWQPLLALIGLLLLPINSSSGASTIYFIASLLTLTIAIIQWNRVVKQAPKTLVDQGPSISYLIKSGMPLLITNMCQMILLWSSMLIIGIWATATEVGVYGVAHRIGLVISGFLMPPIDAVLAPRFAELSAVADFKNMERLSQKISFILIMTLTPAWILISIFPNYILQLFGNGFTSGATALVILATGQLINVATGPVRLLLIMNGKEVALRNCMMGATLFNLLLCLILIPHYGAVGAAIATALSIAGEKLVEAILVYKKLRIKIFSLSFLGTIVNKSK